MDKIREVSLDMTEVVSVLTIAMDFTCLRIQIVTVGGRLMGETLYTCAETLTENGREVYGWDSTVIL